MSMASSMRSFADPNLISFENSVDSVMLDLAANQEPYEIKFFNKAFVDLVGKQISNMEDLDSLIDEQFIFNPSLDRQLSLKNLLANRLSNAVLSQVHHINRQMGGTAETYTTAQGGDLDGKKVTFRKNDIIFEDKASVMLNLIDVTNSSMGSS